MTNDYPFLTASLYNAPQTNKETYIELFRENMNQQFENASDVWTIKEEYPFASSQWQDIVVRINHVIDSDTGEKRGDDYKKILFKELDHTTSPGQIYRFSDNIWLTYNTESLNSLTSDALVTRCNNVLRWLGSDGGLYEVPCAITELIKQTRDYSTAGSSLVVPAGFFEIYCQMNEFSNKIQPNQRFMFGNPGHWTCFRVHGAGIQNYRNLKTYDNNSAGIIRLIVGANFVNDQTDDIVRGICDVNKSVYQLTINNQNVIGNIGRKIQLTSTLKFNGETVVKPLVWLTDNENVVKVDENGLVTLISSGSAEILCSLENNPSVTAFVLVTVSQTPVLDYEIILFPNRNYILEGETVDFDVRLYLNGILQSNTFMFSLNAHSVPSKNYMFTGPVGNTFTIQNKKLFLTDVLSVTCAADSQSKTFDIKLKGY